MKTARFIFILFLIIASCKDDNDPVAKTSAYLNEILDVMEKNSLHRADIDWTTFRSGVTTRGSGAQSIEDLYPAIQVGLKALGDHHSFYVNGDKYVYGNPLACPGNAQFFHFTEEDNIGAVKILSYTGTDPDAHAKRIQDIIQEQDREDLVGWAVDLRGNTGGNMWPMIAGLGPVLGEETLGYFIFPDNTMQEWQYMNGQVTLEAAVMCRVTSFYTLKKPHPKVAVLIDQATASSGEAVAVAFMGRQNTKIFGVSTCGLSTCNQGFKLSDGAMLWLTVATMADRNKNEKGGQLVPDVTVAGDEEVVAAAIEWLKQ